MSTSRSVCCAVAVLAAALVVGGCGSSTSVQRDAAAQLDANQQQDSGPVCAVSVSTGRPACDGCLAAGCCDQATACQADAACKTWMDCASACQPADDTCIIGCWTDHPAGEVRAAYSTCMIAECATECGTPECGGWYWSDATCGDCNKQKCCAENTACGEDVDCFLFANCQVACAANDTACFTACYHDYLAGAYARSASAACMFTQCPTECGITPQSCGGWTFTAAACGTCTETNCCDEWTAITQSADAWDYLYCAWGCGSDQTCLTDCYHTNWRGAGVYNVASFCQAKSCGTECSVTNVPTCGYISGDVTACNDCSDQHCCDLNVACSESADCMGYLACYFGCAQGDTACTDACFAATSDRGLGYFYAFELSCLGTNCNSECGYTEAVTCGGAGFVDTTCDTCLKTSCCTEAATAFADPEALSLELCIERCTVGDTACETTCKSGYTSDAQTKVQAFRGCVDTSCGTDCWTPPQADGGSGT